MQKAGPRLKISPPQAIAGFLKKRDDVLIYHYSRGWDFGLELLADRQNPTVIRYHNVTLPEFFVSYKAELTGCVIPAGSVASHCKFPPVIATSASAYNMRELIDEGAPSRALRRAAFPSHRSLALCAGGEKSARPMATQKQHLHGRTRGAEYGTSGTYRGFCGVPS